MDEHRSFRPTGHNIKVRLNKKWGMGFIIAILVVAGFYWAFVRPSMVRKDCHNRSLDYALKEFKNLYPNGRDGVYDKEDYNTAYSFCLRENGL